MYALPDLPYDYDALGPFMSADTLHTHHDKHHKTYVDKANDMAAKSGLSDKPLEDVVREAHKSGDKKLFNNAAQAWNHAFFWESMRPPGGEGPSGDLLAAIEKAFESVDALKAAFVDEGVNHFASGWAWLVTGAEGLKVISTHDADDTLVRDGLTPLLVCDVWEHAYYIDYKNDRKGFLERWFDNLANWDFAAAQLAGDTYKYPAPTAEKADA